MGRGRFLSSILAVLAAITALSTPGAARVHAAADSDVRTIYVVRHAEKLSGSKDPELSADGISRSKHLAQLLSSEGIQAIYVTEYKRTLMTGEPLAKVLGISPRVRSADKLNELVEEIQHSPERHFLVVGHGNTILPIIEQFGGPAAGAPLDHTDYSRLYVLKWKPGQPLQLSRSSY